MGLTITQPNNYYYFFWGGGFIRTLVSWTVILVISQTKQNICFVFCHKRTMLIITNLIVKDILVGVFLYMINLFVWEMIDITRRIIKNTENIQNNKYSLAAGK